MKKMSAPVMLVFLIGVGAGCCFAAQTNDLKNAFQSADTNLDGKVSLDEFKQHVRQTTFDKADRDGNKKIDKQEWKTAVPSPRAEADFGNVDKNRNDAISFMEFSTAADRDYNYDEVYNALDRNRDGSLSPDEYNARPAFTIFSIKF